MNSKFESIRHRKRNRNIYFWDHYRGHCDLNETVWINLSTTQPAGKHFKPSESSRVKQIKNNLMISAYAHLSISVLNCEIEIKTSRMAIIGDNQEIQFFFQSVVWQSTAEGACLDFYIWCWILKPSNACCYAFDAFSWRSPSMETGASSEFNIWLNLNGVNCFRNKETLENVENHYLSEESMVLKIQSGPLFTCDESNFTFSSKCQHYRDPRHNTSGHRRIQAFLQWRLFRVVAID